MILRKQWVAPDLQGSGASLRRVCRAPETPGDTRADLVVPAGGANFTWNDLFTIQPFGTRS